MLLIYFSLGVTHKKARNFAIIFQGVMFQLSRFMKIALQKSKSKPDRYNWRPSIIAISSHAVDRSAPKDILKWLSHHYGFGTLIHYTKGKIGRKSNKRSKIIQSDMVQQLIAAKANYTVSYQEILHHPEIKAVTIASPAVTHFPIAREALLAGKDVFVEKPLALTAKEGQELVDIAAREKRILMVGHILQYHLFVVLRAHAPNHQTVRHSRQSGAVVQSMLR